MTMVIYIIASLALELVLTKIEKISVYLGMVLQVLLSLAVFNIISENSIYFSTEYNSLISVLICISLYLRFKNKGKETKGILISVEMLKVIIPSFLLCLESVRLDLRIVLSVVFYLFFNECKSSEKMISYFVTVFISMRFFITNYFESPLASVNYIVGDIQNSLIVAASILSLLGSYKSIQKEDGAIVFWPVLSVVLSQYILKSSYLKDFYITISLVFMFYVVLVNLEKINIALIFTGMMASIFINPLWALIPFIFLFGMRFNDLIDKKVLKDIVKSLKILLLAGMMLVFQSELSYLGIVSIILFILIMMLKSERILSE